MLARLPSLVVSALQHEQSRDPAADVLHPISTNDEHPMHDANNEVRYENDECPPAALTLGLGWSPAPGLAADSARDGTSPSPTIANVELVRALGDGMRRGGHTAV